MGLKLIGWGRNRAAYISRDGRWVYKVPLHEIGMMANEQEARPLRFWDGKTELGARRRLVVIGGVCVLVMEYLKSSRGMKLPEWTMSIDCAQVGISRDGTIKAYDWDNL